MLRSPSARAAYQLRRLDRGSPGAQAACRCLCTRGGGRNLPIATWFRGGPFGAMDSFASRMMDRHMRQMERMMDDMMSGPSMWPRWTDFGLQGTGSGQGEVKHVKYNSKEFEIKLDASSFKPEDLEVKVTQDTLTLSAKHEQKQDDYGYVSREFTRQFAIPENVDVESMETILTNEGALVVRAKVKGAEEADGRKLDIKTEEPKVEEEKKD